MWHGGENETHIEFWWVNLKKREFARPRHQWYYNIKIGHEYILREGMTWIHLAEDTQKW
jgi:hypothetical protein